MLIMLNMHPLPAGLLIDSFSLHIAVNTIARRQQTRCFDSKHLLTSLVPHCTQDKKRDNPKVVSA